MGLWHAWLPPLVLWVPEGYPPLSGLKVRAGAPIKKIADIDAWRPEASMTGWPGWLACLAWLGWLGWIGWNDWLKSSTLDALEEVGGFESKTCAPRNTNQQIVLRRGLWGRSFKSSYASICV